MSVQTYLKSRRFALITALIAIAFGLNAWSATPDGGGNGEDQAFGITTNFGKWTGGTINWVYNSTNAPAGWTDDAVTAAAFQSAIDEWTGICNVEFNYLGVDDSADITDFSDNTVVFEWDAGIGGAAGQAGPASTNATIFTLGRWNYVDGTLKMNPTVFAFAGGTPAEQLRNETSFHAVAVHELGHLIGLGHADVALSIMYANPYNSIRHITEDDRQACRTMYGYSDVYKPRATYEPPSAGTSNYSFLWLTEFSDMDSNPIVEDDGSASATDTLALRWQTLTGPYPRTLTQVVVDPDGYLSSTASIEITGNSGGKFGITRFSVLREIPGEWTMYVIDSTNGTVANLPIDVTTSLPVTNAPPDTEFTFTDQPVQRAVSVTANVTGDNEGDLATIIWHIPGSMPTTIPLGASSGSSTQTPTFFDNNVHEIFAQVNDDAARYVSDPPNNVGPAGVGFHGLYRYISSPRNHGPDFDGDNSSDVFWRNYSTGRNWMYSMNGAYIRESMSINTVDINDWLLAGQGDYNGDGKSDVVWRNQVDGRNWMYLMDGPDIDTSQRINTESNQDWEIVANGDFDGNGNTDIFWRNSVTGKNWIYLMNGANVGTSQSLNTESDLNWQIVATGDFDGDGIDDIFWRNSSTGKNWIYLMNGIGLKDSYALNTESDTNWQVEGSGDFNNDGTDDILWYNTSTGQVWVYMMDNGQINGAQSNLVYRESNLNWQIVGVGDYDGDGASDIFWRNTNNGRNWVWFMDGTSIRAGDAVNLVLDQNWQIVQTN